MAIARISGVLATLATSGITLAFAQPLTGVTQVVAGIYQSCALMSTGSVKCWGSGYGNAPVDVPGLTGIKALAIGGLHACALTVAGGVRCWGSNHVGQLGDGTTNATATPVGVVGLSSGVAAIAAGDAHTCAALESGGLKCWGGNSFGSLGNGTFDTRNPQAFPIDVVGLNGAVTAVSAGGNATCAIVSGAVKCWGQGLFGQLGDGRSIQIGNSAPSPVDVAGLSSGVAAIAMSRYNACALTGSGSVKCWGYTWDANAVAQISSVPIDIQGLAPGIVALAAGSPSCAVTATQRVQCWGGGWIGDLSTEARALPTDVHGLAATQVSVGDGHSCALTTNGGVRCWGGNQQGALGLGSDSGSWSYAAAAGSFAQQQAISFPGGFAPRQVGEGPVALSATASSGLPVEFSSVTPSTCTVSGSAVTGVAMGICTVVAYQPGDPTHAAAPAVARSFVVRGSSLPRLANLSTRMYLGNTSDPYVGHLIAGFVIGGTAPKTVILRAIGPSLAAHGVLDPNPDPSLVLSNDGSYGNDSWQYLTPGIEQSIPIPNPDAPRIEQIGFAPSHPAEAVLIRTLQPGAYTARIDARGPTGTVLLELYELDRPESPLINISSRGVVRPGDGRMIAGFVIQGDSPRTVAIVGTGPSLASHGIANPVADPTLTLVRSSDQSIVAANDNWTTTAGAQQLVDKGLAPANPLESAVLVTLPPGAYTAILGGANGSTGTGVVGVYEVQ